MLFASIIGRDDMRTVPVIDLRDFSNPLKRIHLYILLEMLSVAQFVRLKGIM